MNFNKVASHYRLTARSSLWAEHELSVENKMTAREQIAKQRKPYLLFMLIGAALFVAGFVLQNTLVDKPSLVKLDGTLSVVDCIWLGLAVIGFAIFAISYSLIFLRDCCPCCGKNIAPSTFRRIYHCPYCGINLDTELSVDNQDSDFVHKQKRKEWMQHMAYIIPSLLCMILSTYLMILYVRILELESDRSNNAKNLGRFFAQACRNTAGEKTMRDIFNERLSRSQTSSYIERVFLPTRETDYCQKVLEAFEKELLRKKGNSTINVDTKKNIELKDLKQLPDTVLKK